MLISTMGCGPNIHTVRCTGLLHTHALVENIVELGAQKWPALISAGTLMQPLLFSIFAEQSIPSAYVLTRLGEAPLSVGSRPTAAAARGAINESRDDI